MVGNIVQELGALEYESSLVLASEYWIITIACASSVLATFVLIILAVYRRRSSVALGQFRRLQVHLSTLESNIRNECKQGKLALFSGLGEIFGPDADFILDLALRI